MTPAQRSAWHKAIMALLALLVGALLGWLSGCSAKWTPAGGQVNFLWPDRDVELKLRIDGTTTQPAEATP